MPSKSKAESRAMFAACAGKSKLGIKKKVGCEFAKADKRAGTKSLPERVARKKTPKRKRRKR